MRFFAAGIRFKQGKLRPTNQLPEVAIKTDQVLTEVDRRSGKPCIRHGISLELFLDAKLPQDRPLRAKRRKVDTLSGEQRIDKGQGVVMELLRYPCGNTSHLMINQRPQDGVLVGNC